jgi:hypothetical protein
VSVNVPSTICPKYSSNDAKLWPKAPIKFIPPPPLLCLQIGHICEYLLMITLGNIGVVEWQADQFAQAVYVFAEKLRHAWTIEVSTKLSI